MCGVICNFSRLVNLLQILVFVVFSDQTKFKSITQYRQPAIAKRTITKNRFVSVRSHETPTQSQTNIATKTKKIGTLRFATARCCYGYEKSTLLPVTSARALQYGFPAVACFSATAKYFVWRSLHYVSINFHFHAIFMIILLFSEVKFKD